MDDALGAVTLFVADLAAAGEFYRRVFDVPLAFEDAESVAFRFGSVIVNLLLQDAAVELIEPATVATTGTRLQLSIFTDDVDARAKLLADRGVPLLNGPIDRPWGMRTLAFADPDGHVWEYAQEISAA